MDTGTGRMVGRKGEAADYLQASDEALRARLVAARGALDALEREGSGEDTCQALLKQALERPLPLATLEDRKRAHAELLHVVRMCETSLRIRELKRNKRFTQDALRLLFEGERKRPGSWLDLFKTR